MNEDSHTEATPATSREWDLWQADKKLLAIIDGALFESSRLSGDWLACSPGCSDCCIGPFAITPLDADRLRRGLMELALRDPDRAQKLRSRAMAVTAIMSEQFPGNLALGILNDDNKAEDRFCDRFASLHCPSLDPGTGLCDLYLFRPLSCRMCGPPIQIGEYSLPPCHRCFVDAPEHEIEKCRVIPDPAGLEDMILGRLGKNGHLRGSTVVAFALATHL